jgi:transcriptional regulator with XRE-family HTH domain
MRSRTSPPPDDRPLEALGLVVRSARVKRGLTLERASTAAGVSRKQWARLEEGQNASARFIRRVAHFLDLHVLPLGHGLDLVLRDGALDLSALVRLCEELILVANRIANFAVEAALPPSERTGDAEAILSFVDSHNLGSDDEKVLNATLDRLASASHVRSRGVGSRSTKRPKQRRKRED